MKKFGFTLAEVLITLTIIGVVAALTMPALIQNHKKQVLETRLAKFVSTYRQAVKMVESENGDFENWMLKRGATGEEYFEHFNNYIGKYLKTINNKILSDSVAFALPDGSGFIYYYNLKYCVEYKKCLDLLEKAESSELPVANGGYLVDGKNVFLFEQDGKSYTFNWDGNIDNLKNATYGCRENNEQPLYCAAIIERNGWKIPKDYPLKF